MVHVNELENWENRTLVYGYDCDRNTYHLYMLKGVFYSLYYDFEKNVISKEIGKEIDALRCRPNKRVYPESCDFEFAKLLKSKGLELPYTRYNDERAEKLKGQKFHGLVIEE